MIVHTRATYMFCYEGICLIVEALPPCLHIPYTHPLPSMACMTPELRALFHVAGIPEVQLNTDCLGGGQVKAG